MKGADSNFPRQEGPPFSSDKGPLVEDRQSWSQIQPQRGLQASQSLRRQGAGRNPGPCVWGGGTRLNRSLSRWINMELTSWGSFLNEVFNSHHAREIREQAQLVLN